MFKAKEIDINETFESLFRNKRIIAGFTILGTFISSMFAISSEKVWQGEFQIVIDSNSSNSAINQPQIFSKFAGLSSTQEQKLNTEIGILESPSVLMSVFEYMKSEKIKSNNKSYPTRFSKWRKDSLNIKLQKNTNILDLTYRDVDKELALKILSKISNIYQEYSGKKRLRDIQLGLNYFKDQIKIYDTKSLMSLEAAQSFAKEQDLNILQGDLQLDNQIPNVINIEAIRIEAANEIRLIDEQLDKIKNLKDDDQRIMYIASTIPSLAKEGLDKKLKKIDTDLARFKLVYKDSDKLIKDLLKEKAFIIKLLKRQVEGVLLAKRDDAFSRLESSERPPGVLIKYRQLINSAAKDKATLDNLENQYRILQLEEARNEDPWELITTPTLLPKPVSPKIKQILAFGSISGFLLGFILGVYLDNKKNVFFKSDELSTLLNWKLFSEISSNDYESFNKAVFILSNSYLFKENEKIAFLCLGDIDKEKISSLEKELKKISKEKKIIFTKNIKDLKDLNNIFVIIKLNTTKKDEVIEINNILKIQNKKVSGYFALSDFKSSKSKIFENFFKSIF